MDGGGDSGGFPAGLDLKAEGISRGLNDQMVVSVTEMGGCVGRVAWRRTEVEHWAG